MLVAQRQVSKRVIGRLGLVFWSGAGNGGHMRLPY
jgi:hypothetical protein